MNQLCAFTGSSCAEIPLFYQQHLVTPQRRIKRASCPGCPAANNANIKRLPLNVFNILLPVHFGKNRESASIETGLGWPKARMFFVGK
jgi:hypothetical protein